MTDIETENTNGDEEGKVGARHSRKDKADMQTIHDIAVEQGANCLKAVSETDEELRVKNYIILFGGRDLEGVASPRVNKDGSRGEYFAAEVDVESPYTKTGILYVDWEHGFDPDQIGNSKDEVLGYVDWSTAKRDEKGIEVERVLNRRAKYMQWLEVLIKEGLVGNSTEPIQGQVKKNSDGGIVQWALARDTLTVTPMEPRMLTENALQAYKSLQLEERSNSEAEISDKGENEIAGQTAKGENNMEKEELKAMFDEQKTAITDLVKTEAESAAKKAVDDVLDKLPEVKAAMNGNVSVSVDEADRPFKNAAEQLFAMKSLATTGKVDPRMKRIQNISVQWMAGNEEAKALLGSNETIPSQGEFLLEPTVTKELLKPLHDEGPLTRLAKRMPVGPNSIAGWINGVDETSRTAGNRWGGVRGYWVAEGDAMTASQPKFRRINWELNQLAVLQYATDNMLKDSALMDGVIRESSMEELKFLVNDAFFRGSGAGQPKGLGTAATNAALISATRTDANEIDHDDILRMKVRMSPKAYARMVWLANPDVAPQIDKLNFTAGTTGILSPYVTYDADGVTRVAGRPVVYNEFSPTLGTLGDFILWDPDDYLYWEGSGIEGASSIHVQFLTNQTVFRFIYRVDGMPASYAALTPYQGSNTTSAYVGLAATT